MAWTRFRPLMVLIILSGLLVWVGCATPGDEGEPESEVSQAADEAAAAPIESDDAALDMDAGEDGGLDDEDADDEVAQDDNLEKELEAEEPSAPEAPATPVVAQNSETIDIQNIRFLANRENGSVVIDASGPPTHTTRWNKEKNQFIIEVANSRLPESLKRPFNTKEFTGAVASVDAYQNPGSTTTRVVIQLRESVDPVVSLEGNSIVMVTGPGSPVVKETAEVEEPVVTEVSDNDSRILDSRSLDEFLAGDTRFYGKKISIEVKDIDAREVFNIISEESGANIVLSDEVKGNVTLKLREVPWDQALVVVMKTMQLGYIREGNVLRIAPLSSLQSESDSAKKVVDSRKLLQPLRVKVLPVSYAEVEELEKQVKPFLSPRGQVVSDKRTTSLIITDIAENIERAQKVITSLDRPPEQVLIESKIVEAKETFSRGAGINWNMTGDNIVINQSGSRGPVSLQPTLQVNPNTKLGNGMLLNLNIGTLPGIGDLNATLDMFERDEIVKVISSPRIVAINKNKAEIVQTTEIPIITTTTTTTATSETVTFKQLELRLDVTPQITSSGGIILDLKVARDIAGAQVGSTGARSIDKRTATTKVLVNNGSTAVIGGIYQSDAAEAKQGVPWFRQIPILGGLFESTTVSRNKNELLIFLTPRLIQSDQMVKNTGSFLE